MYYVYILTNQTNKVLYTGMTNELERRMREHKLGQVKGFTQKYNVKKLVYYTEYNTYQEAFELEKRIKRWRRQWKINIIEKMNPNWNDLSEGWD